MLQISTIAVESLCERMGNKMVSWNNLRVDGINSISGC